MVEMWGISEKGRGTPMVFTPGSQGGDNQVSSGSNSGPARKIPQLNVHNLLSELLAAGVIHSNTPAAKKDSSNEQPVEKHIEEELPDMRDLTVRKD